MERTAATDWTVDTLFPIENFKSIYRQAKKEELCLKAHVVEWGLAEDVRKVVEEEVWKYEIF